jgi:serine phosphatase RsbU (regulator of sigma subunit)/CHASE3 domain sensor protein
VRSSRLRARCHEARSPIRAPESRSSESPDPHQRDVADTRRSSPWSPGANSTLRPVVFSTLALCVVVPIVLVAGFLIRNSVSASFATEAVTRTTRLLVVDALKQQLDEETGIRGFVITKDRHFLQPYHEGRRLLGHTLFDLRAAATQLQPPISLLPIDDAALTNDRWNRLVATPLLTMQHDDNALQRRGTALINRFRTDIEQVDASLTTRDVAAFADVQWAVGRVEVFFVVIVLLIIALTLASFRQQTRLGFRLAGESLRADRQSLRADKQTLRADSGSRDTALMRTAYEVEKRIADKLQGAFAQRSLPSLNGLSLSATYVPATEDTRVGGDWYDAIELPANRIFFAIGDVAGHGIDAAIVMNRSRHALISSAFRDTDPALVLAHVNEELLREHAPMVTAVTGFVDSDTCEIVYSSAGHPPPILLEPGRPPRLLPFGGAPLSIVEGAAYTTHRIQTTAGAILVLYTDGAIEHSKNILEGEALLLSIVASLADHSATAPASFIHNAIFDARAVGDDVAILTIGFSPNPPPAVAVSGEDGQARFTGMFGPPPNEKTRSFKRRGTPTSPRSRRSIT